MNVWQKYNGKKVFIRTSNNRTYSGIVKEIAEVKENLFLISIMYFDKWVTLRSDEITECKEEN
jgi:small nuclear ribonucleoprotein (snRNP)-like protein